MSKLKELENFSKFAYIMGSRTHYYDVGEGVPLILCHGGGAGTSALTWIYNIMELSKDFRVIAPDELGFGLTDMLPTPDYSLTARAKHIIALLDYLKIKAAYICGQSQGAWIAAYITLNHPEFVRKIILCNSGSITMVTGRLKSLPIESRKLPPTREIIKENKLKLITRPELLTDDLVDRAFEYAKRNFQTYKTMQEVTMGNPEKRRQNTSLGNKHISELLSDIKAPTLIIWGKRDDVHLEKGIWLLNLIKNSQMHIFSDSHHHCFEDHHEEFNKIIAIFCKKT